MAVVLKVKKANASVEAFAELEGKKENKTTLDTAGKDFQLEEKETDYIDIFTGHPAKSYIRVESQMKYRIKLEWVEKTGGRFRISAFPGGGNEEEVTVTVGEGEGG
jgi:hypothetical protein